MRYSVDKNLCLAITLLFGLESFSRKVWYCLLLAVLSKDTELAILFFL